MQVFIKRFWGFDPVYWPVVSFSLHGSLTSLIERSTPGDLMAFVGTLNEETDPKERGKLLGLAEFGRNFVSSREALPPESFAKAPRRPNGDMKWPFSLLITRAWRFTDNPLPVLTEVLGGQLTMAATSNAVLLGPDDQDAILALPREEIDVAQTEAVWNERAAVEAEVGPGGTMGPIPASFVTTMRRNSLRAAKTYVFQFGSKDVWKVGWAHDPVERLADLNKHVPYEVLKQRWGGGWTQKWASADQAYAMEQRVFGSFSITDLYGERVHCTQEQMQAVWMKAWKAS